MRATSIVPYAAFAVVNSAENKKSGTESNLGES
jgi:hypothetical protein